MADTLTANVAESVNEMIHATIKLVPHKVIMPNLVTKVTIEKGYDRVDIPRVNSTPTILNPTEGDELTVSSQFDLTSTTIQPTHRAVMVRLHERATYFSKENLIAVVSDWLAQAEGRDMDTDLTAEFANFGTGNDVGTTNTDLTIAVVRQSRRLLFANTIANGGPAPTPLYCVISPLVEENLYTNLGLQGVVGSTSPWIPQGMSQELIESYFVDRILGVPLFRDGYMTEDASSDFICSMFSKESLMLAISKNWDMKTFEVPNWIGVILRAVADYNSGIRAFPLWGSQITADGA